MEERRKITVHISDMSEFANLFFATYSLNKTIDMDNKIYISKHFIDIISNIVINYDFDNPSLLNDQGFFDMKEFIKMLQYSNIRKYWASDFIYDFQKDCICTEINKKTAETEITKYDEEEREFINQIVEEVINNENIYENNNEEENKVQNRKYIYLYR